MEKALRIIIAKSPAAAHDATLTLRAMLAHSPIVGIRYERTVDLAMNDPLATFSPDDREIIAAAFAGIRGEDGERTILLPPVRVTPAELEHIHLVAARDNMSLAQWVRMQLHLPRNL